jgi:hypothetical protein
VTPHLLAAFRTRLQCPDRERVTFMPRAA